MRAAVAASGTWTDSDGFRMPSGEVHAWLPGTNQTLCGLSLYRSQLQRFPHVDWRDVDPAVRREVDRVAAVCPKCTAGMERRRTGRRWARSHRRR